MRRRGILHRLIIALTVATFIVASVAGVEENNSKEVSAESEGAVSDVTTETTDDDAEYEEDVDEYEEELREVAESHEAMSRDERGNSTSGVNHSEGSVVGDDTGGTRNFDSREKSVEESSDESMTSNEAISDETEEEREKGIEYKRTADGKSKRVPTVKKELSSQKELLSNDTTGESPEIVGRLAERSAGYSPARTREMIDNDLGEEWVQAESLMKLLVRLAKNPERWERAHRLLTMKNPEEDLQLSSSLDSRKRGYPANLSPLFTTLSPQPADLKPPPKKPKKKKKKKKKPKHQQSTTTSLPPTPLTTQRPPSKPETHWRLVAERLFGPGWSGNRREPTNFSKLHYTSSKSLDHHDKYPNDEMPRDYTRKFHFGKVNTHEKGSPLNQQDSASNYDLNTNTGSHVLDYDLPERNYQRPRVTDRYDRYHHYMDRIREFGDDSLEDYEDTYPDVDYPRHQGLYGKSWRYSTRYEPARGSSVEGYYDESRQNFGRYRPKPWTVLRPVIQVDDEDIGNRRLYNKFGTQWPADRTAEDIPWGLITEQRSKIFRNSPASSTINNKNRETNGTAKTKASKEAALPKIVMKPWNKLTSEPTEKDVLMPKLTMKTWNSLTSDPATWPFKLSGAKPWPKDKNGKSYNPNAELVRKLGLDKQNRMLEKGDEKSHKDDKSDSNEMDKATSLPQRDDSRAWKMGKSKSSWGSPEDKATWSDSWQGKLTDWNVEFGKPSQSSTWTPKWKQFSYHKVNAGPVSKPGGNLDGGSRARNAFIAMSAVTPSRFPGNEWRKNDIEETVDHSDNSVDRDDPASQMLDKQDHLPIGQWIKSTNSKRQEREKTNRTDILENQLEELRQSNVNNGVTPTQATYSQSTVSQATYSTASTTESTSNKVEHSSVDQKSNHTIK